MLLVLDVPNTFAFDHLALSAARNKGQAPLHLYKIDVIQSDEELIALFFEFFAKNPRLSSSSSSSSSAHDTRDMELEIVGHLKTLANHKNENTPANDAAYEALKILLPQNYIFAKVRVALAFLPYDASLRGYQY